METKLNQNSFIIAPAGYGKTHFISDSVSSDDQSNHVLILTHTNAGVLALNKYLQKQSVPSKKYTVSTIASWCLKYSKSFPLNSGITNSSPQGSDWSSIYPAMLKLLQCKNIQDIIKLTYDKVYIDEYQDCIISQHKIIISLSKIIPCVVLGDPLQGIFDFEKEPLVDMVSDLTKESFVQIDNLNTPWRWKNIGNDELGLWLDQARKSLLEGEPIDLTESPSCVHWIKKTDDTQIKTCFLMAKNTRELTVAIHNSPIQCHYIARRTAGCYQSMEEIESKDLMDCCNKLDTQTPNLKIASIIEICSKSATKISTELKTYLNRLKKNQALSGIRKYPELKKMIEEYLQTCELEKIKKIICEIFKINHKMFRRELINDLWRSIELYLTNNYSTLTEAAWQIRNNAKFSRKIRYKKTISRTLLIKGMEFDHVLILDADGLDMKNFYVAITRGQKTLTIISQEPIIIKNK